MVRQLAPIPPFRRQEMKDRINECHVEEDRFSEEGGGALVDVCEVKIKIPLRSTIVFAPDVRNHVNNLNEDGSHESSSREEEKDNKKIAMEHDNNETRRRDSVDRYEKVASLRKGNSQWRDTNDSFYTNLSRNDFCPGESGSLCGSSVGVASFVDMSQGPGTAEEAATFLSSTLREKLLTYIPPLASARRSTAPRRGWSDHPDESARKEEGLFVVDAPSPLERAKNVPGSAWFWEGYRAALYGHQVFFHLRGTGVHWREDGLLPQALLRQPAYLIQALRPYAVEVEGGGAGSEGKVDVAPSSFSSAFIFSSSVCSRAALLSSFLQLTSCKLDILSSILSSLLTHLLLQPLLEAHEGPSALLLCATKDECEECYTLLSSWAAPFHLLVHNAWDPLPPFTLRLLSSSTPSLSAGGGSKYPTAGIDGGKVTDIVIATPPLWEHLVSSRSTFTSGQTYQRLCGLPSLDKVGKGVQRQRRAEGWRCKSDGRSDSSSSPFSSTSSSSSLCWRTRDAYSCFPVSFLTANSADHETSSLLFSSCMEKQVLPTDGTHARIPNAALQASASTIEEHSLGEMECDAVVDEKEKKECWEEMLIVLERLSKKAVTICYADDVDRAAPPPPPRGVRRVETSHRRGGPKNKNSIERKTLEEYHRMPSSTPPAPLYPPFIRTPYSPLIRPYQLSFITQIALINVNTQLAMGYGPLLERIFLRREGVNVHEHPRKVERQGTGKDETMAHTSDWRGHERKRKRTSSPSFLGSQSTTHALLDPREKAKEMIDWLPEDVQWYAIDGNPTVATASIFPPVPRESAVTETMDASSSHRSRTPHHFEARVDSHSSDLAEHDDATEKSEKEEEALHEIEIIRREHHHFVHTVLQRHWGGGGIPPDASEKAAHENEASAGETQKDPTAEEKPEERFRKTISSEQYGVAHIHLASGTPPCTSLSWRTASAHGKTEEKWMEPPDGARVACHEGERERLKISRGWSAFDTLRRTPVKRVEGLLFLHGITASSVYLDPSVFADLMEGVKKEVLQFWDAFGPWTTEGGAFRLSSTSSNSSNNNSSHPCPIRERVDSNRAADLQAMHPQHFFTFRLAFLQENVEAPVEDENLKRGEENAVCAAWLDNVGVLLTPLLLDSSPSSPFSHLFHSRWGLLLSHLEEKMNGVMFDGHVLQTARVALWRAKTGKENVESASPVPVSASPFTSKEGARSNAADGVAPHDASTSFPLWSWYVPSSSTTTSVSPSQTPTSSFSLTTHACSSDTRERSSLALDPTTKKRTKEEATSSRDVGLSTSPSLFSSSTGSALVSWSNFQTALWQSVLERLSPAQQNDTNATTEPNTSFSFYAPSPAFLFSTPHPRAALQRQSAAEATGLSPAVEREEGKRKDETEEVEVLGDKESARLNAYRWMTLTMKAFPAVFSQRVVEMEKLRRKKIDHSSRRMREGEREGETDAVYSEESHPHPLCHTPPWSLSDTLLDGHAAHERMYCPFPYLCLALTGTFSSPPSVRDRRDASPVPLVFLPPAPLFSVVVLRHVCPGFCKETFASMTTSTLCRAFAEFSPRPSSSTVPRQADVQAASPSLVPPPSPPLPTLSVCIEECCKIGRVLSFYCFEDGKTKRQTRRVGEGTKEHEWTQPCRCFHHQDEKEEERSSRTASPACREEDEENRHLQTWPAEPLVRSHPSFSLSVFIEFERTEAAVEAVRLFQRQLQEVQQRQQEPAREQQQDADFLLDRREEQPSREDSSEGGEAGAVRSPPAPSPACHTPYYCLFPTVQLFRNEDYYKGVAEEEKQIRSTIQKLWDDGSQDDFMNEDDSDDEDSDLEDIFSSHLSCLAEVQ